MNYEYEVPDDVSSSADFLSTPCWAHVLVEAADTSPKNNQGNLISGAIVGLSLSVLAADNDNAVKKTTDETIFEPKLTAKDGGKFAKKKIARLAIALGFVSKFAEKGKRVSFDWNDAVGRQMIVKFGLTGKEGDEKRFIQFDGAHTYHVDDPEQQSVPRDPAMIEMIPKNLRWSDDSVAKAKEKASTPQSEPAPAATPKRQTNVDAL